MTLFFGTLLIVLLCCLIMGLGMLLDGRRLAGGCDGRPPGSPECADCPRKRQPPEDNGQGESGC